MRTSTSTSPLFWIGIGLFLASLILEIFGFGPAEGGGLVLRWIYVVVGLTALVLLLIDRILTRRRPKA